MTDATTLYGFTAVPRSSTILKQQSAPLHLPPRPLTTSDIPLSSTPLATAITTYASAHLPKQTYNHSLRVFYYGQTILQHFPSWTFSAETYLLCCLLHDIGATPSNIHGTHMSFEFYGGMLAYNLLLEHGAEKAQAESVMEAIVRHQDVGEEGTITAVGQLLQLATIFDNMGGHQELVARATIEDVVRAYPRMGWSRCFHDTIREETAAKPWAHTTALGEGFPTGVLGNRLMAPFD